ncbi:hypothetical protein IMZ48_24030 [Candidatus Bathyarchaeota archaeon]|nr:hypothetical protein [Candidatus Bathyarchaeota archaeon]
MSTGLSDNIAQIWLLAKNPVEACNVAEEIGGRVVIDGELPGAILS